MDSRDDDSPFTPTLPADHVAQITSWHERAYHEGRAGAATDQTFGYLGATIVVPADVMPITPMSHLLGEAVAAEVRPVQHSDVFSTVDGSFDLIIFDPPFRWFRPRDLLESAITDDGYRSLTTFFREARDHLSGDGRMLIFFGTSGDLGYLQALIRDHDFTATVVAHDEMTRDGWKVEYFTYLVR